MNLLIRTNSRILPHWSRYVVLLCLALLVTGCETMDQGQCMTADWHDVGYRDGAQGGSRDRVGNYASDCSEYGVRVDTVAYRDGWDSGIRQYCTADNGYRAGVNGQLYEMSCPGILKDRFYSAYLLGDAVYNAQSRLDQLRYEVEEKGDEASKDGITDERRAQLRRDREKLKDDMDRAEIDLAFALIRAQDNGF